MKNMEQRVAKMERQLNGIEKEMGALARLSEALENESITPVDEIWQCTKCGSRLGIYDKLEDVLRIRYRDLYAYFTVGVGGRVKIVCRSCSEINELTYTDDKNTV